MIDIAEQITAIDRRVAQRSSDSGATVVVTVKRRYPVRIDDVWTALTDPERVRGWFLPLSGDLTEGGTYQLEGNSSGDILTCERPGHLVITFGGPQSVVDLRLSQDGRETVLELEHTVPVEMAGSSAGALYVGPGWDGALNSLSNYLAGEVSDDPVVAAGSPETQVFGAQSVDAWAAVVTASGTSDAEAIASARKVALEHFAPDVKRH